MKVLYNDIVQQISESQVKLGFSDEAISLYYKKDGLESRLGHPVGSLRATADMLSTAPELNGTPLGPLVFAPEKGRLKVTVPAEGVRYVHENVPASAFLADLVHLFGPCGKATKDAVQDLFARYGSYQSMPAPAGADFDFVMRFDNPAVDPYYYCFTQEGDLLTYHRLTKEDYAVRTAR